MKFEDYHRRLLAEKVAGADCPRARLNIFIKRDLAAANQKIDSLDQRLARAEIAFYRQRWWQFWRPSQPEI